uniref:Uncharacterized protein n=1 Tax=Trichuris muris TaxID=70415 RepID=A0A5S6QZ48_TRIMR
MSRVGSFCCERTGTDGDQAELLITKLNGSNYQIRKLKMKVLLMKDGLWDVVNQAKPEPTPQACLRLHEKGGRHCSPFTSGRQLAADYIKRKLYSMRFTHGMMQSHLNAMLEIVAQLRGMGKNVEDDDLLAVMLCSLPDSYSALITALEGRDEADLTVECFSGKLLDEYQRRVENNHDQSSSETVLKSTARNEHGQSKWSSESDSAELFISLMRVFFDIDVDIVYSQCVLKPQRTEVTQEAMKAMLELHEAPEFKHELLGSIIVGTSIMLIGKNVDPEFAKRWVQVRARTIFQIYNKDWKEDYSSCLLSESWAKGVDALWDGSLEFRSRVFTGVIREAAQRMFWYVELMLKFARLRVLLYP